MAIRVTRQNLVPLPNLGTFFVTGLLFLVAVPVLLWMGRDALASGMYRHPTLLAAAHVTILGWATAIALAALQQMVPVVFSSELAHPELARWAGWVYGPGVAALVSGLATLRPEFLVPGAVLVPAAIFTVLFNVWQTQTASEGKAARRIRPFVMSALSYLAFTVLAGVALAFNLATGWLGPRWALVFPAHVTLGLAGWFGMLVLGISYHLLPFFGLTPKKADPRWDRLVLVLLHAGIIATWLSTLTPGLSFLGKTAPAALVAALGLFLWETRALFASRPREKMHPMVTYVRLSHLYLALLAGTLLHATGGFAAAQVAWAGVLGLGGWLTNAVLGYLHRILPFYVWHNKYWDRAAEPGVPTFRDMVAEGPAWVGLALYNAGVIGLLIALPAGLALHGYLGLLFLGAAVAAANLLRTYLR